MISAILHLLWNRNGQRANRTLNEQQQQLTTELNEVQRDIQAVKKKLEALFAKRESLVRMLVEHGVLSSVMEALEFLERLQEYDLQMWEDVQTEKAEQEEKEPVQESQESKKEGKGSDEGAEEVRVERVELPEHKRVHFEEWARGTHMPAEDIPPLRPDVPSSEEVLLPVPEIAAEGSDALEEAEGDDISCTASEELARLAEAANRHFSRPRSQRGSGSGSERERTSEEMTNSLAEAYCNRSMGDAVCQAITMLPQSMLRMMVRMISGHVRMIAKDSTGINGIVTLSKMCASEDLMEDMIFAVQAHVPELCLDRCGKRLILQMLIDYPRSYSDIIIVMISMIIVELSHNEDGSVFLRECLTQCTSEHKGMLAWAICQHIVEMSCNRYGSTVVMDAIANISNSLLKQLAEALLYSNRVLMSNEFGRRVVEYFLIVTEECGPSQMRLY